jgi:hypothetical protein
MGREWRAAMSWALVLSLALSTTLFGQQVLRGSIAGTIKDETGSTLPGVTLTVTSPALQVPQIVKVSDERGEYQVPDLPAGTYRVIYELAGFGSLVREGIVLTTGFNARVDPILKVATLAETVTVTGETPLVDVTSTRGGTTVSKDLISAVPGNKDYQDTLLLVGGTNAAGPPLNGRLTAGQAGFTGKTYGAGGGTAIIEGVKMNPNEVPDFTTFEEVDVKTFGNTADVDTPGAAVQLIVKSGGNQFHGDYTEIAQSKRFQANNIDATLRAQGISTGDAILYYNDLAGDLGGRIIRDKLWFYGAVRDMRNKATVTGLLAGPGPDGKYLDGDDVPGYTTARHLSTTIKISYQATPKNRFIGFWQDNPDYTYQEFPDRFSPMESEVQLNQYSGEVKPIQWQSALSNRWVIDMAYANGGYNAVYWYDCIPGRPIGKQAEFVPKCNKDTPATFDRTTGLNTGPSFSTSHYAFRRSPMRKQVSGSVNYLPGWSIVGSHDLQFGYRLWFGSQVYQNPWDPAVNGGIGDYQLIYDTVGGVPHQPTEIDVLNRPVLGTSRQNEYAWYAQDTWRPTKRLTMNVGLRWERQRHYVPPQVKVQGTFGTSGNFPLIEAGAWNSFAPRTGVAFDLSGDGKTVAKSTYGWFNDDLGVNGYAQAFNQNSPVLYAYRWNDPTHCNCYLPGTVNLDVNGPAFLSVSGVTNNRVNPNLRLPHTHEATGSLERELGTGLSVRGLFVYKKYVDGYTAVNVLRPYSVYDQVFTRRDPGPDGAIGTADDGGLIAIYDYNPAYRGAAFVANMNTNADPGRHDSYKNFEVTLTKRATGNWFANTSVLATKNHRWLVNVVQSPNDNVFALDATWDVSYRLAAGYNLPFGINVSTLYQAYTGLQRQRTNLFRATDPAGGPTFPSSSTITMRMEPFGSKRGPARNIVNLRAGKDVTLGGGRKLTMSLDAFNAFNTNVAWGGGGGAGSGITDVSGPSYGYVVRLVYPRVLRFNVGYQF